jgi:hypothetical protein
VLGALTKPTVILSLTPLLFVMSFMNGGNSLRRTLFSSALLVAVSALLLVNSGGFNNFIYYALILPAQNGDLRLQQVISNAPYTIVLFCALIALTGGWLVYSWQKLINQPKFPASVVLAGLLVSAIILRELTNNNPALSSLNLGAIVGLAYFLIKPHRLPTGIILTLCVIIGAIFSYYRMAQESVRFAKFSNSLKVENHRSLKWGEPTKINGVNIRVNDIETMVARLKELNQPFFVFPDLTILYSMVKQPAKQPLLWFHPGLTYPRSEAPQIDHEILTRLRDGGVKYLVLEESSFLGTAERLIPLPRVRELFYEKSELVEQIGTLQLRKVND